MVRKKAGVAELKGGLCTQQVAVQRVVRAAAKHWASGLQGTVGRGWGSCGERQGRKMSENRKDGTS